MNSQGWFPLGLTDSVSLQYQSEKDQCQGHLRTCFGSEKRRAGIELYWEAQTSQVCMWEISKLSQDLDHPSLNFMRQYGYKQNTGFSVQDANFVFFELGLMQFSALHSMTVSCLGCSSYPESWWLPDLLRPDFILGQGTQTLSHLIHSKGLLHLPFLWESITPVPSSLIQFSSVAQSCLTLCNSMDCSVPGFPVHHQLLELPQTHVHRVSDAIQPFPPLVPPSPLPLIFPSIRVFSSSQFFTSYGHSIGVSASASVLPMNIQDWFPLGWICLLQPVHRLLASALTTQWVEFCCFRIKILWSLKDICMLNDLHLEGTF